MQETLPLVGRAFSNELRGSQALCKKSLTNFFYSIHILIALNMFCTYVLKQTLFNEGLKAVEIPL